jgi:hypothetical protein
MSLPANVQWIITAFGGCSEFCSPKSHRCCYWLQHVMGYPVPRIGTSLYKLVLSQESWTLLFGTDFEINERFSIHSYYISSWGLGYWASRMRAIRIPLLLLNILPAPPILMSLNVLRSTPSTTVF